MPESSVYQCFLTGEKNSFIWEYSLLSTMLEISRKTHKVPVVIKEQCTIDGYQKARKQFENTTEMVLTNEFNNDPNKRTLLAPNRFPVTGADCTHFLWWDREGNEKSSELRLKNASKDILAHFPSGHRFLIFRNPKVSRSVPTIYHLHVFVKPDEDINESKIDFIYEFDDEPFEDEFQELYIQWKKFGDHVWYRHPQNK